MSNFTMIHNIFSFLHRQSKSFQVFLVQFCHQFIVPCHKSFNFLHCPGHKTQQLCPIFCHNDFILDPDWTIVVIRDFVSTNQRITAHLTPPEPRNSFILSGTRYLARVSFFKALSMAKSTK